MKEGSIMMVMTAKVDLKKIMLILTAVAALILALLMLVGEGNPDTQTAAPAMSSNDGRVRFLTDFGWDVTTSPKESGRVKIPEEKSEVFDRYNALQKSQGYDLSQYAGKSVMRFVYKVNNFPGATEPVYATLLVYKNRIIGGDVTDTAAKGQIRGLKMADSTQSAVPDTPSESTAPAEPTASAETTEAA